MMISNDGDIVLDFAGNHVVLPLKFIMLCKSCVLKYLYIYATEHFMFNVAAWNFVKEF